MKFAEPTHDVIAWLADSARVRDSPDIVRT